MEFTAEHPVKGVTVADIKLVAVDEDGTFLRDHVHYDLERFERLWKRMAEQGIRFVVATGNQLYQVRSLFPAHTHEMGYVTGNGALVCDGDEQVFAAKMDDRAVQAMIDIVHANPAIPYSMLGVEGAYIEKGTDQSFFDTMSRYCTRQYWVEDFSEVKDQIFMFSSVVDASEVYQMVDTTREALAGAADVVSSGEGYFDVVCTGVNKATGLQRLLDRWNILPEECVAFGDSDNDLAMLKLVGRAYAMENAPDHVKEVAERVAPPCTEDGVLQVLEELLG